MSDTASPGGGQPLGIGTIVGESFSLTFKNFFGMLALIILPLIIMAASGYLLMGNTLVMMMIDPLAAQGAMADPSFMIKYLVWVVIMILAFSFYYAGAIKLIFDAKTGGRGSIGGAISAGLSGMVRLFVMYLVLMIMFFVVYLIVALILGVVVGGLGIPALAIVAGIGVLIFFLWLYGMFAPFPAIVCVENEWFGAIGRSVGLTKGYRWPIVGCVVVFILALIIVYLAIGLVAYVAMLLGTVGLIIAAIVGIAGAVVIYGSGVALISLIYARLREIKEGTSMESLADVFS